jgi:BirA family biotin operon repressor/biotin-[acetyl-CoA-carboxylase] ligase
MHHQHFNTIPSTQIYLKDNLEALKMNDDDILISCSEQTNGVGRRENSWENYSNSIAMSFTLKPNQIASLTPIEIGIAAIIFLKNKFNKDLFLKWPNDLLNVDGKKCGGILCQYIDNSTVIVGLGINLGKLDIVDNISYRHGLGNVDQDLELQDLDRKIISHELYNHFLANRFNDLQTITNLFNKYCFHINKQVCIFEDGKEQIGIFKGIGNNGEALVEIDSTIHSFLSSSLTIIN